MQRAIALKVLLVLFAAVITAPAARAFNGCRAADVTGDGRVDEEDLFTIEERLGYSCPRADLDGSGVVDGGDLDLVLRFLDIDCSTWCPADLNDDDHVDMEDRALLIAVLGQDCTDPDECPFDLNEDGTVDTNDLWFLLASCGPCGSLPAPVPLSSSRRIVPPNPCAEGPDGRTR